MAERKGSTIERIFGPLIMLILLQFLIPLLQQIMEAMAKVTAPPPEEEEAPPEVSTFSDNFDDNVTDPDLWETFYYGSNTVQETGGRVDVNCQDANGNDAGYVTKNYRDLTGKTSQVDIDMDAVSDLYAVLHYSPEKTSGETTATGKAILAIHNDFYRIQYQKGDKRLLVVKKVSGTQSVVYDSGVGNVATCTKLRIREEGGTIYFEYYDGSAWHTAATDTKPTWLTSAYVYLIGAASAGVTGHVYFDNFSLS